MTTTHTADYSQYDLVPFTVAFRGASMTSRRWAMAQAQEDANANGAPVVVWTREGWYHVSDAVPDMIEPQPETLGWSIDAIVEPVTR